MSTSHSRSLSLNPWFDDRGSHERSTYLELIEASGGLVRAGAVAKRLGVAPEMIERLRLGGRLLAVPLKNGFGYPVWQFDGRGFLSGLATVLRALDGDDPWQHVVFFLTPNCRLDGQRPLDALRDGHQQKVL